MYIDRFLRGYRDYLLQLEMITDYYPSQLSYSEEYVLDRNKIDVLENFDVNLQYLESNIDDVRGELRELYTNIFNKLDKLVDISEGYQKLNTNELLESTINNLAVYDIKGREYYDTFLDSISLPRQSVIKNYKSRDIERDNNNALERYRMPSNKVEVLGRVNVLDEDNSLLKRIVCSSRDGTELLSTSKTIFEIPSETFEITVVTDNIDKNVPSYTSLDILTNKYGSSVRTAFEDRGFKKEGKLLKLIVGKDIPTDCYITAKLTIRYKDVLEHVYFNVGSGNKILTPKREARGDTYDLLNNRIQEDVSDDDELVLGEEYSTNEQIIKYKGNGVFDISKVNSKEFNLGISFSLYSMNPTTTPQIKSLFAYTTN